MAKSYSFLKKQNTEEKHIFEGDFTTNSCTAENSSICKKATQNQGNWVSNATCLTDQKAREKAAELGRSVCGTCVSHLFTTY